MDETFILNELKSLILSKTGIRTITPADCKRISIEISKTLNKNVSETTIKRLFGFAMVKHNFSKFTLTTLSEYVNEEYLDNGAAAPVVLHHSFPKNWKDIHEKANKITEYTIKGIKNRAGMPYEMTISRKFSEHDFEVFFKSDHSFTAYISQPGYGRSILLSHLAEKLLINERALFNDSTLFFVTSNNLIGNDKLSFNFEEQLKAQLGIQSKDSLITYANQNYEATGGKLIIFLDGFSGLDIKKDLKRLLFDSIINFICAIENQKGIKLVMSMRSTTWCRFYNDIRLSAYLKTKWFPGSYFNVQQISNVPPLTEKEVDLILSKITPSGSANINPRLKEQLKFPYHIQLYYQLKKEDPLFNYTTNITFHELIFRLIQSQIYRSNYYTEKIFFLKKLILLTDYGRKNPSVVKAELINELLVFKNAYMELLSDGILMEEQEGQELQPTEYVKFIHPHVFEYFLFIETHEKFKLTADKSYFEFIHSEFKDEHIRFQLLQWGIRFHIKIADFKSIKVLFDLELSNYERNYLILFIAENLHYRSRNHPETIHLLSAQKFHDTIIAQLVNFDFVDSFYKEAISIFLQITDDQEHLVIYNALHAIFDILSLDNLQVKQRLSVISSLKSDHWEINPQLLIQTIYSKLNAVDENSELILNDIQKVASKRETTADLTPQHAIQCVLLMLLSAFYDDAHRDRLKDIIVPAYKHSKPYFSRSPFSIFVISTLAFIHVISDLGKKGKQMENILLMLGQNAQRFKLTKYTEAIIRIVQAKQLKNKKDYSKAYQQCLECLHVFKGSGLNLNCLYVYDLIINIFMELQDIGKANEYKYEMLCFMEDLKISNKFYSLRKNQSSL